MQVVARSRGEPQQEGPDLWSREGGAEVRVRSSASLRLFDFARKLSSGSRLWKDMRRPRWRGFSSRWNRFFSLSETLTKTRKLDFRDGGVEGRDLVGETSTESRMSIDVSRKIDIAANARTEGCDGSPWHFGVDPRSWRGWCWFESRPRGQRWEEWSVCLAPAPAYVGEYRTWGLTRRYERDPLEEGWHEVLEGQVKKCSSFYNTIYR